jgi:hypothetical protein
MARALWVDAEADELDEESRRHMKESSRSGGSWWVSRH